MGSKQSKIVEGDSVAYSKSQTEVRQTDELGHDYIACIHHDYGKKEYIIEIFRASTQNCVALLKGHTSNVTSVAFNAKGSQVLSGSWQQFTLKRELLGSKTHVLTRG